MTTDESRRILAGFEAGFERNREWLLRGGPDVRFDEFLNVSVEAQNKLKDAILPLIDGNRKRKRKPDAEASIGPLLGCIVSNAIIAMGSSGPGARVHYSRGKMTYVGPSLYKPNFLHSRQLRETVDALADAGLIEVHTGQRGSTGGLEQSTYWPTERLIALLREFDIGGEASRDPNAPVIFLRSKDGKFAEYDAGQWAGESARIRSYNAFIGQFEIRLAPTTNAPVNLKRSYVYRIFNHGSFDLGGRFYGGWWENCPKELRDHITIDGEATVERDYSTFVPRALYRVAGAEPPADPYDVPELRGAFTAAGVPWDEARPIIKQLTNIMLNAKGWTGVNGMKVVKDLPTSIPYKWAFEQIQKHNKQIGQFFFEGPALAVMQWESDICSDILDKAREDNVPILPIHDSFRVRKRDEDWLVRTMSEAYEKHFASEAIIK